MAPGLAGRVSVGKAGDELLEQALGDVDAIRSEILASQREQVRAAVASSAARGRCCLGAASASAGAAGDMPSITVWARKG